MRDLLSSLLRPGAVVCPSRRLVNVGGFSFESASFQRLTGSSETQISQAEFHGRTLTNNRNLRESAVQGFQND
jgi:hypothetical protein